MPHLTTPSVVPANAGPITTERNVANLANLWLWVPALRSLALTWPGRREMPTSDWSLPHTGSAIEYFTWLSAKLDSIEAMPSSRVSLFFRNAS